MSAVSLIIDLLAGSERADRYMRRALVLLAAIEMPIIVYLAIFLRPEEYPGWWQKVVDWFVVYIPATTAWSSNTLAYRNEMPAIYAVWFLFGVPAALLAALFSKKWPLEGSNIFKDGLAKGLLLAVCWLLIVTGIFWFMYLNTDATPSKRPSIGVAGLDEHVFGLRMWTVNFMFANCLIIGMHLTFIRIQTFKIIKFCNSPQDDRG